MWARVSRFAEPKDRIDEDIEDSRRLITELLSKTTGNKGVYYLVDRTKGQTMAITLWESEEAMRASEQEAARIRQESTQRLGGEILGVDHYEVAIQPADVMAAAR